MKRKPNYLFLSLLSALLLSAGWLLHFSLFIFFAFVPLLQLEADMAQQQGLAKRKLKLFAYTYLTFLSWNLMVTWWVSLASFGGACMAFILNSLFMSIVFVFYSTLKNRLQRPYAVWLLIPLWLGFEYIHTIWDLSWTWLTLGNVFAFNTTWIQWFEFTGTTGGSLWALLVNILIFNTLKNNASLKLISKPVLKIAAAIIFPILISYTIFFSRKPLSDPADKINCVVVQPNIDPYSEKFYMDYRSQFEKVIRLIKNKITAQTDYLVLPETFITADMDEEFIDESESVQWFKDSLIKKFPKLKIVVGTSSYKFYKNKNEITSSSRIEKRSGMYMDYFNTGLQISAGKTQLYHKSKLVPGAEIMPLAALLKPLEGLALDMGGTMGSLGVQKERAVFTDETNSINVAPVICYESIYADFVTEYVRKKANIIFIITNDGWWGNTPGHVQHLYYARLRAIENRLQIARSANTGISCFIDEFGTITDATNYWEDAVIERTLYKNNHHTFFSRFGDLLAYTATAISALLVLLSVFLRFRK